MTNTLAASLFLTLLAFSCGKVPRSPDPKGSRAPGIKLLKPSAPLSNLQLTEKIKTDALAVFRQKPADFGRKTLLSQMGMAPQELAKDILRRTVINVGVEENVFSFKRTHEDEMKAGMAFEKLSSALREAVIKHRLNSDIFVDQNKIGQFYISEIIYYLVQNFTVEPLLKYGFDRPDLKFWHSMGPKGDKLRADIIFYPKQGIIKTTTYLEKTLSNADDENEKKKSFLATNCATFDLNNGTITYSFSYSIDGNKKEWTQTSFIDDETTKKNFDENQTTIPEWRSTPPKPPKPNTGK